MTTTERAARGYRAYRGLRRFMLLVLGTFVLLLAFFDAQVGDPPALVFLLAAGGTIVITRAFFWRSVPRSQIEPDGSDESSPTRSG